MSPTEHDSPDIRLAQYEAFKLTKEFAITRPEDIQLDEIAMALGIYIREEYLSGAEARLIRNKQYGVIRINAAISQAGRKRFTIAHELGHWRLHDSLLQICTERDILGASKKVIEAEANAFSGAFLLPTPIFSPKCIDEHADLNLICELANQFSTTVTATALRFIDESRFPCTAVFSEDNKVSWWRVGQAGGPRLERGWEINQTSTAWDPPSGVTIKKRVSPRLWIAEPRGLSGTALFEQSIPLGRYGIVLTLLSLEEGWESEDDDSSWSRTQGHSRMQRG